MPNVNQQKNLAYRPRISGENVTYRNTKGQNVTTKFHSNNTIALPLALSETVTGKTPNVTKSALEEAFWKHTGHIYSNDIGKDNAIIIQRAERLIDHYAEKISEDEEKGVITQNEQFKIMEMWHKWFGFDD